MPTIKKARSSCNQKGGLRWVPGSPGVKGYYVNNSVSQNTQDQYRSGTVSKRKKILNNRMVNNSRFNRTKFNMRTKIEQNENGVNRFFGQTGRVLNNNNSALLLNNMYHTIHHNATKKSDGKWHIPTRKHLTSKEKAELKKKQEISRQEWERNFLKRADDYITDRNKPRYEQLANAKRQMNNHLNETRQILESTEKMSRGKNTIDPETGKIKARGWDAKNRNQVFRHLFTKSRKQLDAIIDNPEDYIDNPSNYMYEK
jgi:hypothetical protein